MSNCNHCNYRIIVIIIRRNISPTPRTTVFTLDSRTDGDLIVGARLFPPPPSVCFFSITYTLEAGFTSPLIISSSIPPLCDHLLDFSPLHVCRVLLISLLFLPIFFHFVIISHVNYPSLHPSIHPSIHPSVCPPPWFFSLLIHLSPSSSL